MRLLVTGGCGFIGSNFIRFAIRERTDCSVINLDVLAYAGNLENLAGLEDHPQYRFVRGDIGDRSIVDPLMQEVDAVVHFAAESHVDRSIIDATPFIDTNVRGTQSLLDAVRQREKVDGKRLRFVHVSTDEVFGDLPIEQTDLKFNEQTPYAPSSPYAASKAASDLLVRAAHHTFGMDVVITNCSNNFGRYQFPEKVIPLFVTNLIEGRKVPLYGDGRNVRDWLHVEDHCEAVLAVLDRGKTGETYCIGGNNERSNLELTHMILELMDRDESWIERVTDRPGHDRRYAIDASKIERELGWRPSRSVWPGALADTIAWYQDNPSWWQGVKSGAYRDYYEHQYGRR